MVSVDMKCAPTFSDLVNDVKTEEWGPINGVREIFEPDAAIGLQRTLLTFKIPIDFSRVASHTPCVKIVVWARRRRLVRGIGYEQFETVQLMHVLAQLRA